MNQKLFKMIVFTFAFFFMLSNSVKVNAANTTLYNDISSNHWAYESILTMSDLNIMKESSDGNFYPNRLITRAEAVQYMFNALNIEKTTKTEFLFKDVPQNATYRDALYTLTTLGVIYDTQKFNPNNYLTRAELCKLISIAFDLEVGQKNKAAFRDVSSSHWAKNYIESLADIQIVKGTTKTTFSPNQNVTRAQMATFLERSLNFQNDLASNDVIYDYLQKKYIDTINHNPNWSLKVIELVNKEREKAGLSILKNDSKLTQLSVIKGNDMFKRNYFDHYSPLYGYAWDMAGIFDYSFTSIGENIAKNYTSPESVVQAWLKSPSHKANMMNENYTNIGVSCVSNAEGLTYWVQLFSKK